MVESRSLNGPYIVPTKIPMINSMMQAFADLIVALDWSSCVILYEESEALVRLQEVLKLNPKKKEIDIQIRQLEPGPGNDHRLEK